MSDPENTKSSLTESAPRAVSDGFGVATEEFRISMPIGFGAVVAALASLATCYSGILATYIFGFQSFSIKVRYSVQGKTLF